MAASSHTLLRMLIAAGLLLGLARAQHYAESAESDMEALTEKQMRELHSSFDADKDGKSDIFEVLHVFMATRRANQDKDVQTALVEMDQDKSNTLSMEEIEKDYSQWVHSADEDAASKHQRLELERAKFKAADADGNGQLDGKELSGYFHPDTDPKVLEVTTAAALKQKDLNGDGRLSVKEFWEDTSDGEDPSISKGEQNDFNKLDSNFDEHLSMDELLVWESGEFHAREATMTLISIADKDDDAKVTADELVQARMKIARSDAHYHLMEWAEQREESGEL